MLNLFAVWLFVCYLGDEGSSSTEESNKPLSWFERSSALIHVSTRVGKLCPGAEPVVFVKTIPWCFGATPYWNTVVNKPSWSWGGLFFFFSSHTKLLQCTVDLTTPPPVPSSRVFWSKRAAHPLTGALMSNVAFCLVLVHTPNRCRAANVSERTDRPWLSCESVETNL